MNERIRELERKCWEPRKHPVSQAAMGDKFNTEKFALLIVSDCLEQISQAIPDTDCSASGHYRTARLAAVSRVQHHFGHGAAISTSA